MSRSNTLEAKFGRRLEKSERTSRAAKGITRTGKPIKHCGVIVSVKDVKRHRYLAMNDLPYSQVATVMIPSDAVTGPSLNV